MILEIFFLLHASCCEEMGISVGIGIPAEIETESWTEWSEWSICSMRGKTCGYGISTRDRNCKKNCGEEIAEETKTCVIATCAGKIYNFLSLIINYDNLPR